MNKPITGPSFYNGFSEKADSANRWIVIFVFLLFAVCLFTGCVHFFYKGNNVRLIQLGAMLLLGSFYAGFLQRKMPTMDERSAYAIFLCIGMPLTLCALYFFAHRFQAFNIISFGAAFALPYVLVKSWQSFAALKSAPKSLWYCSKDIPAKPMFVYLENKPMRFKLITEDHRVQMFEAVAPLQLQIGLVFFYMIKGEKTSETLDRFFFKDNGRPYGWVFYVPQFFGLRKKYLDPHENLFDHKIKSDTLIIAKRVR